MVQAPAAGAAQAIGEVADSTLTLAEEIEAGSIPTPGLLDWSAWQLWRGDAGREPPRPRGEPNAFRLQRESRLWRATMSRLYGLDWRQLLRQLSSEGSPEAEARYPSPYAGAPAQGSSLVPAGLPPGPLAPLPASTAVAVAAAGEGLAAEEALEVNIGASARGSDAGDEVYSQGSWAEKSTEEIRAMLRDFIPEQDDVGE